MLDTPFASVAAAQTAAPATSDFPSLRFEPFAVGDIPAILPMLASSPSRTCDFTVGGIYLWKDYFMYTRCIVGDTLFIKGVAEDNLLVPAFSLPVGALPLGRSLAMLRDYCRDHDITPLLSAVPTDRLDEIRAVAAVESISELPDWADYLYDIDTLATFKGKKMNKKRNHLNRFAADWPDASVEPLTSANLPGVLDFLGRHSVPAPDKSVTADYDILQTGYTLRHLDDFNYEGLVLSVPGRGVVAFTVGEVIGDTLYVHIEKMDHELNGSGETVSSRFCAMMLDRHPALRYVNREDSSGDPGLAKAKEAYRPIALLRKYNVTLG